MTNMWKTIQTSLEKAWQRGKSHLQGRRGTIFTISHNSMGLALSWLSVENETGSTDILWTDVTSILAYKRDCFTVDQIRMYINLNDNTATELTEDMQGWEGLLKKLPEYLPGCKQADEWWAAVAFPAFDANVTTLYKREKQSVA